MHAIDAGPQFYGWAGEVEGEPTCVVPPVALTDETAAAQTAAVMRQLGADCRTCSIGCLKAGLG